MNRLWGIRHLRFCWHAYWCARDAAMGGSLGLGLGYPNQAEREHLDAIWAGRA